MEPDQGAEMKSPLVDHWWSKIAERSDVGLPAAKDKLAQLAGIEAAINNTDGAEAVRNVLADGAIRRALERCIEIHEGNSNLDATDLSIYFNYATVEALKSQKVIDDELDYLGL